LKIERDFLELVKQADTINIDLENYPKIDAEKILGEANILIQKMPEEFSDTHKNICVLWMVYALIEKSAQYYRQAALNSFHPALKIFMGSLCEVKDILRVRTAACVRIGYNDIWGKIGFAPFVLGKD
jgi:hypothetical protein